MAINNLSFTTSLLGIEFMRMSKILRDSFVPLKGVPLHFDKSVRAEYYTSTTATALLALHHVNALNKELYDQFYDTLFWIRDHTSNLHSQDKLSEDAVAWDIAESASVWATSLAVWALIGTGYNGSRSNEIKDAIVWLLNQQKSDGGWGFDSRTPSSLIFTAPTLHVLNIATSSSLNFTAQELSQIDRAKNIGVRFILENCHRESKTAFWKLRIGNNETPDPTATLYAIWSLFEIDARQHKSLIQGGIEYLRSTLQNNGIWELKTIATETNTKYGVHKIVISFTPSFVIFLLRAGCNPFEDICFGPIQWLGKNRLSTGWNLPGYSESATSFATAYAIWTMGNWSKCVVRAGLQGAQEFPFLLKSLRKRITVLTLLVSGLFISLLLLNTPSIDLIKKLYGSILPVSADIQLIASILALIGISGLYQLLVFLDSNILNHKFAQKLNSLRRQFFFFLFLEKEEPL